MTFVTLLLTPQKPEVELVLHTSADTGTTAEDTSEEAKKGLGRYMC